MECDVCPCEEKSLLKFNVPNTRNYTLPSIQPKLTMASLVAFSFFSSSAISNSLNVMASLLKENYFRCFPYDIQNNDSQVAGNICPSVQGKGGYKGYEQNQKSPPQ